MNKKKFENGFYYSTDLKHEKKASEKKAIDFSQKVFIALNKSKNNKSRKYYCPKGVITNNFRTKNICISPDDI
jgi:hypothetical protein